VYIHKNIYNEVVERLIARAKAIKHGDPHCESTVMGAMINREHAMKVIQFLERAKSEVGVLTHALSKEQCLKLFNFVQGAKVLVGGELVELHDSALKGGSYISPCILGENVGLGYLITPSPRVLMF